MVTRHDEAHVACAFSLRLILSGKENVNTTTPVDEDGCGPNKSELSCRNWQKQLVADLYFSKSVRDLPPTQSTRCFSLCFRI